MDHGSVLVICDHPFMGLIVECHLLLNNDRYRCLLPRLPSIKVTRNCYRVIEPRIYNRIRGDKRVSPAFEITVIIAINPSRGNYFRERSACRLPVIYILDCFVAHFVRFHAVCLPSRLPTRIFERKFRTQGTTYAKLSRSREAPRNS